MAVKLKKIFTINWRSYHGGKSSEQGEKTKSAGEIVETQQVHQDDGREGDVGRHEESKEQRHDRETGVGGTEGEQEDGEGGENYCYVGHHQGVHPGEVGDPARYDSPEGVGDADDGDKEGRILDTDIVLRREC